MCCLVRGREGVGTKVCHPKYTSLAFFKMAIQRYCRYWNSSEELFYCQRNVYLQRKLVLVNSEFKVYPPKEGLGKITSQEKRLEVYISPVRDCCRQLLLP